MVRSDGAPGVLLAKFVAHSASHHHEVELQAKDEGDVENAGGHPWTIDQNIESTLLLFNHSPTAQVFTVRVTGGDVDWQREYRLASMQTKAISIRDLVEQQVKDDTGKVLPKGTVTGETSWLVTDFKKASGRLVQSDRSTGMARNFSCGYSGLLCGSSISIFWLATAPGYLINYASITGITCTSGLPNACSGQQTGTANFSTQWSSLNTGIAAITGSTTSPPVNVTGVAVGSTTMTGRLQSQYCTNGQSDPISTGQKLTVFSVDCSDTATKQTIPVGWNKGTCTLGATLGPFPAGGTCVTTGPNNQYVYHSGGQTHHVGPIPVRIADNGCTHFIDGISIAYTDSVTTP